jgi:hypothetical protein
MSSGIEFHAGRVGLADSPSTAMPVDMQIKTELDQLSGIVKM